MTIVSDHGKLSRVGKRTVSVYGFKPTRTRKTGGVFSFVGAMVTSDGHALRLRGLVYVTVCGIRQWSESSIRRGTVVSCVDCLMENSVHETATRKGPVYPGGRPSQVKRRKRIKGRRIAEVREDQQKIYASLEAA